MPIMTKTFLASILSVALGAVWPSATAWAQAARAGAQTPGNAAGPGSPGALSTACPPLLDVTAARLQDDVPQRLCQYAGQVVLVVNTASFCGFTGQYEGLEALYEKYRRRGFVVLGFPSNDFGQQEPGSSREIADFCFNTYAVKFPMFSKTVVSGARRNALYAQLAKESGTAPKWNFYKYLIDRNGRVVDSYNSMTAPLSKSLVGDIEKLL